MNWESKQPKMKQSTAVLVALSIACVSFHLIQANSLAENDSIGRSYPLRSCSSCGLNECRVMGMQRYSEPRCEQFGGLGASCRMWQEPENKTLYFPNSILECADVYMQYCPCGEGLTCDPETMTCQESNQADVSSESNNQLEFDENEDEIHEAFRPNEYEFPWGVGRFH